MSITLITVLLPLVTAAIGWGARAYVAYKTAEAAKNKRQLADAEWANLRLLSDLATMAVNASEERANSGEADNKMSGKDKLDNAINAIIQAAHRHDVELPWEQALDLINNALVDSGNYGATMKKIDSKNLPVNGPEMTE